MKVDFKLYGLVYKHKPGFCMEHEIFEYFDSLTDLYVFLFKIKFDLEYYRVFRVLETYFVPDEEGIMK